MELTKEIFTPDCGLKWNKEVILNRDHVFGFFLEHPSFFEGLAFDLEQDSMVYGYLEDKILTKVGVRNHQIERIVIVSEYREYERYKAVLKYDGTNFSGFQVQSKERSVQGEIEKVLSEIENETVRIAGASRTDAGVHALGQVFHFDTNRKLSTDKWMYYFSKRLPKDMFVTKVEKVHPLFHSRYDVYKKEYRYRINTVAYNPLKRNFEWFQECLDYAKLEKEMASLIGTFDFTSFAKGDKEDKVRTIYKAYVDYHKDYIELVFVGDGFLRYMIRLMVHALVDISRGKLETTMIELIEEKSRRKIIHLAPASGLYLTKIDY